MRVCDCMFISEISLAPSKTLRVIHKQMHEDEPVYMPPNRNYVSVCAYALKKFSRLFT